MEIKVISVINMKGGVGKTTFVVNLAGALARFHKKKVLLIDNDPQFNATQSLVSTGKYIKFINDQQKCSILDIYRPRQSSAPSLVDGQQKSKVPKPSLKNCTIRVRKYADGHVDLLPSTLQLMELDAPQLGTEQKLSMFIDTIKGAYNFILIDCPPTLSLFTLSAFIASDGYMVPIKPDRLSSIGIPLLERAINSYSQMTRRNVLQIGVVFSMVKKHTSTDQIMQALRNTNRYCFSTVIKQGVNAAKAVEDLQTLFEFDKSKYTQGGQVQDITIEFLDRIKELQNES